MSLKGGVLFCWIVTWFGSVTSDPFYCDDEIVPGIEPLPSYIYHCDGVSQVSFTSRVIDVLTFSEQLDTIHCDI